MTSSVVASLFSLSLVLACLGVLGCADSSSDPRPPLAAPSNPAPRLEPASVSPIERSVSLAADLPGHDDYGSGYANARFGAFEFAALGAPAEWSPILETLYTETSLWLDDDRSSTLIEVLLRDLGRDVSEEGLAQRGLVAQPRLLVTSETGEDIVLRMSVLDGRKLDRRIAAAENTSGVRAEIAEVKKRRYRVFATSPDDSLAVIVSPRELILIAAPTGALEATVSSLVTGPVSDERADPLTPGESRARLDVVALAETFRDQIQRERDEAAATRRSCREPVMWLSNSGVRELRFAGRAGAGESSGRLMVTLDEAARAELPPISVASEPGPPLGQLPITLSINSDLGPTWDLIWALRTFARDAARGCDPVRPLARVFDDAQLRPDSLPAALREAKRLRLGILDAPAGPGGLASLRGHLGVGTPNPGRMWLELVRGTRFDRNINSGRPLSFAPLAEVPLLSELHVRGLRSGVWLSTEAEFAQNLESMPATLPGVEPPLPTEMLRLEIDIGWVMKQYLTGLGEPVRERMAASLGDLSSGASRFELTVSATEDGAVFEFRRSQ